MEEIIRNRTIRPSSRLETSKSYKIDTKNVDKNNILVINIDHESTSFKRTYRFNGSDVANRDSISFRVYDYGTSIDISWSGVQPIGNNNSATTKQIKPIQPVKTDKPIKKISNSDLKTSFEPISDSDCRILILGTIPGDKSLEIKEYYGNPQNKFWEIIANITKSKKPSDYKEKKQMLLAKNIGIWDVAHNAKRKGSLDINITDEAPNDIEGFIRKHKNLTTIVFNGKKSEALYDKYFDRKKGIKYLQVPSTSPANTSFSFVEKCRLWKEIL